MQSVGMVLLQQLAQAPLVQPTEVMAAVAVFMALKVHPIHLQVAVVQVSLS
jgi:hypothetical protein